MSSKFCKSEPIFLEVHSSIFQISSSMYGIQHGKVQSMNANKLLSVLCQSSMTFVPVDDPAQDCIDKSVEVNLLKSWTIIFYVLQ